MELAQPDHTQIGKAQVVEDLKPELLIVEGTSLRDEASVQEPQVHEAAREVVQRAKGLVIADFSARNIERLRTFRDMVHELGRKLVITPKDAYLLEQMHVIAPRIPRPSDDGLSILRSPRSTKYSWEKDLEKFDDMVSSSASTNRVAPVPSST